MKSYHCQCTGHDILMEEFDNIREFVRISDSRPENSWSHETYIDEEDREMFLHGWDSMRDKLKTQIAKLEKVKTQEKKIVEKVYGYNGYYPNVSRAVRGNPRCMGKYKKFVRDTKIVEVIWDPGAAACEKAETVEEQGIKLLLKIKALELAGYRVKLMIQGFKGQPDKREIYMCKMTIKEENQPLDLSRIAYPLANVDMLRKWVFYWYEHLPDAEYISGYGRSLYLWGDYNRQQVLDAVKVRSNQYYVNLGTDIEKLFNPLLERK